MRLTRISLSKIQPNPDNPRGIHIPTEDDKLEALQDSIRQFDVMVPVVVTPKGTGYLLIDGERRFHAATKVGLKDLPAYIIGPEDKEAFTDAELVYRMFQIHHLREQWPPIQQCQALESIYAKIDSQKQIREIKHPKERLDRTVEELSRITGIEERTAADRVKFLRWPKKFRTRMYESKDKPGYSYVLEIEDKIVIPALINFPEYFEHVDPDEVRLDLFNKLEHGLARATEVRRVAPFFRAKLDRAQDKRVLGRVLTNLRRDAEMSYEQAQDVLESELPDVQEATSPSPTRLLTMIKNLSRGLEAFDADKITSKLKGKASAKELRAAIKELKQAIGDTDSKIGGIE